MAPKVWLWSSIDNQKYLGARVLREEAEFWVSARPDSSTARFRTHPAFSSRRARTLFWWRHGGHHRANGSSLRTNRCGTTGCGNHRRSARGVLSDHRQPCCAVFLDHVRMASSTRTRKVLTAYLSSPKRCSKRPDHLRLKRAYNVPN